jgi:hypothetical protein
MLCFGLGEKNGRLCFPLESQSPGAESGAIAAWTPVELRSDQQHACCRRRRPRTCLAAWFLVKPVWLVLWILLGTWQPRNWWYFYGKWQDLEAIWRVKHLSLLEQMCFSVCSCFIVLVILSCTFQAGNRVLLLTPRACGSTEKETVTGIMAEYNCLPVLFSFSLLCTKLFLNF